LKADYIIACVNNFIVWFMSLKLSDFLLNFSEMFMETNRFSTKTLAAVTSLENFDSR
jgi:hypothetical protein